MNKVCKKCGVEKSLGDFGIGYYYNDKVGYNSRCKECSRKGKVGGRNVILLDLIKGEVWKPVIGYEGLYEVSNMGRIKSLYKVRVGGVWYSESLIKPKNNIDIYHRVELSKNGKRRIIGVHQLVGQAFIKNPENKPNINHINGKRDDNRVENLEWCTQKENIQHAWKTGLCKPHNGYYRKPLMVIDTRKNSTISFPTVKAAREYLGISKSSMCQQLAGEVKKMKYQFQYI